VLEPAVLASVPIFARLAPRAQRALADRAVERRFAAGDVLYGAGSPARGLYVVLDGRVRVVRGARGRQHVVHHETAGGALGEVPLFEGGAYPATAIAAMPTRCIFVPADALRTAMTDDPRLAWTFLARLASRVRLLVDRLDALAARDVTSRLAALLLERHATAATPVFTLGATQTEIAEELGTVREVVVRALRRLRTADVIQSLGGGRYRVTDIDRLKRLADH
jgi:CRP/FNR family transcriptional regulator